MPRKLPSSYLRKLNEEMKTAKQVQAKKEARQEQIRSSPDSGRLKGFSMVCQSCGTKAQFTVDPLGYATCSNCKAVANYRFGNVA